MCTIAATPPVAVGAKTVAGKVQGDPLRAFLAHSGRVQEPNKHSYVVHQQLSSYAIVWLTFATMLVSKCLVIRLWLV